MILVPASSTASAATWVSTTEVSHVAAAAGSSFPSLTAWALSTEFLVIAASSSLTVDSSTVFEPTVRPAGESDPHAARTRASRPRTATGRQGARRRGRGRGPELGSAATNGCGRVSGMAYQSSANVPLERLLSARSS